MPDSIPKEVKRGWELLEEAKEDPTQSISKNKEALQLMIDFENKEGIKPYEYFRCLLLKAYTTFMLGETEESLKIIEFGYQESLKVKKPLIIIDFLFSKIIANYWFGGQLVWENIETMESLLKSSSHKPYYEVEEREAVILYTKAFFYYFEGNYDLAIQFFKRSQEICKRLNFRYLYDLKNVIIGFLGMVYHRKGELDIALQYLKQHIEIYGNSQLPGDKHLYSDSLREIGIIYYQQGDLDIAIDYFKKNLEFLKEINFQFMTTMPFYYLINIMVEKHSLELAKEYLDRFNQYNERLKNSEYNRWYKLSEAVISKASTRTRDRAEAEKILIKLLESHDIKNTKLISEELIIFELCDIYLEELRTTNNLEILGEIHPLIERLLRWTERTNSVLVQAKTKLLQGQISLLEMNMGDARRFLSQAQKSAETHGLHLLARKVSYEHDKLLEQLDNWESLKKKKVPISDRMDLVLPEETIDLILKKRAVKPPELIDEVPVLLLIIAEGGIPAFSKSFVEGWSFEDDIISSFLTAFNSFSEEVFSKGLDRAKFGDYMLVMDSVASFSVCYLFKGQSYLAKQKLIHFAHRIQNTAPIWQVLKSSFKTNQSIELSENPLLESLIVEIFLKGSPEISNSF